MAADFSDAALIFDLDGTLVDTADDLAASMNHALAGEGLGPVAAQEVRGLVGHGARRMLMRGYELSAGRAVSDKELDHTLAHFLSHYRENIAVHSRPFDHAVEMLESFRAAGMRAAICTNKREGNAVQLIEALGLSHLFETIVGGDTASAAKPDPAPVHLCLERTGVRRAVFLGDSDTDIRAANAANLPCLLADFGYGPITLKSDAAAVFSHYREAAELIGGLLHAQT
ncbi:MAG: HAD-IA family hydrolase [Pseudomonadota bacterium]